MPSEFCVERVILSVRVLPLRAGGVAGRLVRSLGGLGVVLLSSACSRPDASMLPVELASTQPAVSAQPVAAMPIDRPWEPLGTQRFAYRDFVYDDYIHLAAGDEASPGVHQATANLGYRFRVRLPAELSAKLRTGLSGERSPTTAPAESAGTQMFTVGVHDGRQAMGYTPPQAAELPNVESVFKLAHDRRYPLRITLHPIFGDYAIHDREFDGHILLYVDDNTPHVGHSGWFGYHNRSPDEPTEESVVEPYTLRRVLRTVDWVIARYPVDAHRVQLYGSSMGGGGVLWLGLLYPERFASVHAISPPVNSLLSATSRQIPVRWWGPPEWKLRVGELPERALEFYRSQGVATSRMSVWDLQAAATFLAVRDRRRPWMCVQTGRNDDIVTIEQYLSRTDADSPSFVEAWLRGQVVGVLTIDERGHYADTRPPDWSGASAAAAKTRSRQPLDGEPEPGAYRMASQTALGVWEEHTPLLETIVDSDQAERKLPDRLVIYSPDFEPSRGSMLAQLIGPIGFALLSAGVVIAGIVAVIRQHREQAAHPRPEPVAAGNQPAEL